MAVLVLISSGSGSRSFVIEAMCSDKWVVGDISRWID
jgi:hypothetical protein